MKLSDIKTGTKLELEVFNQHNEKIDIKFVSQFEAVIDENEFIIAAPISEGKIYPIRKGWKLNIYFLEKDSLYRMEAEVTARRTIRNIAYLTVAKNSELVKVQRRQFFRFECSLPVLYRVADMKPDEKGKEEEDFIKTITRDLSGGGISLLLKEKIEVGLLLKCELWLTDAKKIQFSGEVVRCSKSDFNANYGYEAGIRFCEIDYHDKENIIKYIFSEQRKLIKRGLIDRDDS